MRNIDRSVSSVITFLIVIYPLLSVYGMSQISLGMVLMFFIIIGYALLNRKIKFCWPRYYWLYFVYMMITRVLFSNSVSVNSLFSLSFVTFSILLGVAIPYFNLEYGIKLYKKIVLLSSIFFFVQEIMFNLLGFRISGIIPFLPLNIPQNISTFEFIQLNMYFERSSSFFLEPAHFSQFIIPLFAIELFNEKKYINFYTSIIFLDIVLLRSGTGLILLSLIVIVKIFYELVRVAFIKKILAIVLLLPVFFLGIVTYVNSEYGKSIIERSSEFEKVDATTSAYVRIIRGFNLFDIYPLINKYLGLNSPEGIKKFIDSTKMYVLFQEKDLLFSGIQSILIYGGFVGMVLFLIHFVSLNRNNNIKGIIVSFSFICLSIISPIYLMGEMLLCYVLIQSFKNESQNNQILSE